MTLFPTPADVDAFLDGLDAEPIRLAPRPERVAAKVGRCRCTPGVNQVVFLTLVRPKWRWLCAGCVEARRRTKAA